MIREDAKRWRRGREIYLRIINDLSWPMSSASLSWSSNGDARLAWTMMKDGYPFSMPALRVSNSSIITSIAVSHGTDIEGTHRSISLNVGQKKIEFAYEPNLWNLDARNLHVRVNGQARIIENNAGLFDCGSEKPYNHRSAPRFHFTRKSLAKTHEARPKVFGKTFRQLIPLNFKPPPNPFRDHCFSVFGIQS